MRKGLLAIIPIGLVIALFVTVAGDGPLRVQFDDTGALSPLPVVAAQPGVVSDSIVSDSPGRPAATAAPLLETSSARIEDRFVAGGPVPVGLRIDRLGVAAPVARAGAGEDGAMEVPDGIDEVAWYEFGPAPGEAGSAVMAAHVDMAGLGPGVFFDLHALQPGDVVTVTFDDGSAESFEVFEAQRYLKDDLDTGRIFNRDGAATLTLVTCGGAFNPSLGRYDSNVVVYAKPVQEPSAS